MESISKLQSPPNFCRDLPERPGFLGSQLSWESGGVILELTSLVAVLSDIPTLFSPPQGTLYSFRPVARSPHLAPGSLSHFLSFGLAAKLPCVKTTLNKHLEKIVTETEWPFNNCRLMDTEPTVGSQNLLCLG